MQSKTHILYIKLFIRIFAILTLFYYLFIIKLLRLRLMVRLIQSDTENIIYLVLILSYLCYLITL